MCKGKRDNVAWPPFQGWNNCLLIPYWGRSFLYFVTVTMLLHPEWICLCNVLTLFSSSSSRNIFALFVFAYQSVCSLTLNLIISHNKETFTDLSIWYSSLTPSMVALIWFMYSVSVESDVQKVTTSSPSLFYMGVFPRLFVAQCFATTKHELCSTLTMSKQNGNNTPIFW